MTTTDQRSEAHRAIFAEDYLRTRYGAYKAHPAWRELEDAFNAGLDAPCNIVYGDGVAIDLDAMRLRLELAESVTMPKANAVTLLCEIERLRRLAEENERLKAQAVPVPPPECKTEEEKTAFAFGWWKALESVRAAPTQVETQGWLPIETAPKDFVTEFDGWNGERVPNVTWAQPEYGTKGEYAWCQAEYVQHHGWVMEPVKGLTHWMPLPAAPSQGEKP